MKLIIAEKPSVAQSIATVLGASEKQDGYIEGCGYRGLQSYHKVAPSCPPRIFAPPPRLHRRGAFCARPTAVFSRFICQAAQKRVQ